MHQELCTAVAGSADYLSGLEEALHGPWKGIREKGSSHSGRPQRVT
jgi:hypothetical protein